MKLLLKYMKPYRGLAIVTVLVLMVDKRNQSYLMERKRAEI